MLFGVRWLLTSLLICQAVAQDNNLLSGAERTRDPRVIRFVASESAIGQATVGDQSPIPPLLAVMSDEEVVRVTVDKLLPRLALGLTDSGLHLLQGSVGDDSGNTLLFPFELSPAVLEACSYDSAAEELVAQTGLAFVGKLHQKTFSLLRTGLVMSKRGANIENGINLIFDAELAPSRHCQKDLESKGVTLMPLDVNKGTSAWGDALERWSAKHLGTQLPPNMSRTDSRRLALAVSAKSRVVWAHGFNPEETRMEDFVRANEKIRAPTMVKKTLVRSHVLPNGARYVALPLDGGSWFMELLLPESQDRFQYPKELDARALESYWLAAKSRYIELHLPRFRIATPVQSFFGGGLAAAGLVQASQRNNIDPQGFSMQSRQALQAIYYRGVIEVDEEGRDKEDQRLVSVEPAELLAFNRPFFYFLRHGASGLRAVMGKVQMPGL